MYRFLAPCLVMIAIPALAQSPDASSPTGWSFAGEGVGIPMGQKAADFAVEIDRKVAHGGQASASIRSLSDKTSSFRATTQFLKADAYRGKKIRLAGYLKTRDVVGWCGIWIRADGPSGTLTIDNMASSALKGTTDWTRYEATIDVPAAAMRLAFGSLLNGAGQVWADDLTIDPVDPKEVKTTIKQPSNSFVERASNLDFEDSAEPLTGWSVVADGSYSKRIVEGGSHSGHSSLDVKSAEKPESFFAHQDIAAAAYRGKRVRFRAYLKPEAVADEAFVSLQYFSPGSGNKLASKRGEGAKGTGDWQAQEVVLDIPADADSLCISFSLRGAGRIGVDDATLETVDPASVAVTPESETIKAAREKRSRELAEAYPTLPELPMNLDFEG
jgi:hypothetical protein